MQKKWYWNFFDIAKTRFLGTEVNITSVLIAYYLLLSLFPLFIAMGNILPFLHIDPRVVIEHLNTIVPTDIVPALMPFINTLFTTKSSGLLSIGLLGALWSSSRGISFIQRGINKAYGIAEIGSYIVKRLFSLLIIGLILLLLMAFALVYSVGEVILSALATALPYAGTLLGHVHGLKWPLTLSFLLMLLLLVYRVSPDVRLRLRHVWPGAVFATVGLFALVQGFTIYLRFFAHSFSSYGVLGTFFVLMLWLHSSAIIFLLGAVLNASVYEYHHGAAKSHIGKLDLAVLQVKENLTQKLKNYLPKK